MIQYDKNTINLIKFFFLKAFSKTNSKQMHLFCIRLNINQAITVKYYIQIEVYNANKFKK